MPLLEYNDVTRMTRHQLADRIRQMETTAARNSTLGAPNDRHRPGEDIHRREKIARYRAELDRRERFDAIQAAADARTAADFQAFKARLEDPADPECTCHLSGDAADATDCAAHNPHSPAAAAARAAAAANQEPNAMNPYNDYATAPLSTQEWQERQEQHDARDRAAERAEREADYNAGDPPTFDRTPPTPVIAPPPSPRLAVECPQCHAQPGERCRNYKGQHCHPHGARKLPAAADADRRQAKHRAQDATAARRATVAAIRKHATPDAPPDPRPEPSPKPRPEPTPAADPKRRGLSAFDLAVEQLVADHTLSSVLDAAWEASRRLFRPAPRS